MQKISTVASAFDDRYLWPWAISMFSARRHSKATFDVVIGNVNGELSRKAQALALKVLSALGIEGSIIDVQIDVGSFTRHQWSESVYGRLGLMDNLEDAFLWLDADTLLRPGWSKLFDDAERYFQDPSRIICAVQDRQLTRDRLRREGSNQAYLRVGEDYFNSGVVAVEPSRWRDKGFPMEWVKLVGNQGELGFEYPDQDALNYLLWDSLASIDGSYNHIVSESMSGEERILHFAGYPKPWRLDADYKQFFIALEVLNLNRPFDQLSGGGHAWEAFVLYWLEESLFEQFIASGLSNEVGEALLRAKESNLMTLSRMEQMKLRALRALSKKIRT